LLKNLNVPNPPTNEDALGTFESYSFIHVFTKSIIQSWSHSQNHSCLLQLYHMSFEHRNLVLSCVLLGFFWTYQPGLPSGSFYWARDRDYHNGSNFWKFYLIKTGFTLRERVSLVKVFRLFRLERDCFGVQSVDTVSRCTTSYLLAGPACLWCLVNFHAHPIPSIGSKLDSLRIWCRYISVLAGTRLGGLEVQVPLPYQCWPGA
jgi:hypothetical protein